MTAQQLKNLRSSSEYIAYFSMEIGINTQIPTYSGGLGVLAGDTVQSAADLSCPMVVVSLLYRNGYFKQSINEQGEQIESPVAWYPEEFCQKLNATAKVTIEGREVSVQAYRYDIKGVGGHVVPIIFLDTDIEGNNPYDRSLSGTLYGGDERYRLCQETLLGIGGVRMLCELGYQPENLKEDVKGAHTVSRYHMNEGHAALLTLELLKLKTKASGRSDFTEDDVSWVKKRCLFTTHTPIPAGHDCFPISLAQEILGDSSVKWLERTHGISAGIMNMSHVAMNLSNYINGVSKRHAEVSRSLLSNPSVKGITNGVHCSRWVSDSMGRLFDQEIPGWQQDNFELRNIFDVEANKIVAAHRETKQQLLKLVLDHNGKKLSPDVFTVGFARRATPYKRTGLIFEDLDALKAVAKNTGPIQLIFAGKAHPKDTGGKNLIASLHQYAQELDKSGINMVFLENYNMDLGKLICAGVDLWLNNPLKPLEASGTSGMKSALNGVPSLSTLDGWWIEGWVEGVTGWEIEDNADAMVQGSDTEQNRQRAAQSLCQKLTEKIIPLYYEKPQAWAEIMKQCISINGSYFNTHRMVLQYLQNAY